MNSRFNKWSKWLEVIEKEVTNLFRFQHIFNEVQEIIKKNPKIQKPSSFYEFMGTSYVSFIVMGIRRQIKIDNQSISFARLLKEIIETPEILTRKRFVALYSSGIGEELGNRDFNLFAENGADHIDSSKIQEDFEKLKQVGKKLEDFADKRIAHRDKREPKTIPIFQDIDDSISFFGELLKKYVLLFRAEGLPFVLPVYQYDWKEIFKHAWLTND